MPYLLSAEASFSAAHTLPDGGDCARLHGHNWRVRVTLRVGDDALDESGMGVDFRDLEEMTRHAVSDFEHRFLNEVPPFDHDAPSAERLARVVFDRIAKRLDGRPGVGVEQVELWEMPQFRAIYRPQ
jgi:6-pyruvoyltetrahydropterin/6-carboxytetrahydropterin synthase